MTYALLAIVVAQLGGILYLVYRPARTAEKADEALDAERQARGELAKEVMALQAQRASDTVLIDGLQDNQRELAAMLESERADHRVTKTQLAGAKGQRDALLQAIHDGNPNAIADLVRRELQELRDKAAAAARTPPPPPPVRG